MTKNEFIAMAAAQCYATHRIKLASSSDRCGHDEKGAFQTSLSDEQVAVRDAMLIARELEKWKHAPWNDDDSLVEAIKLSEKRGHT